MDPEILMQSEIEDSGLITIGNAAYSVLILPPLVNLEAKAWAKIKTFLAAGGIVVSLGLLSYEEIDRGQAIEEDVLHWFGLDANSSPRWNYWQSQVSLTGQVQAQSTQFSWARGKQCAYFLAVPGGMVQSEAGPELLSFLKERVLPAVSLDISDASRKSLLMQVRDWPDGSKIVFIANQESPEIEFGLVVEASAFNLSGLNSPLLAAYPCESNPLKILRCLRRRNLLNGLTKSQNLLFWVDVSPYPLLKQGVFIEDENQRYKGYNRYCADGCPAQTLEWGALGPLCQDHRGS